MDRGVRGVDREPRGVVHAGRELVLVVLRDQGGVWLRGADILEVKLTH